MFGRYEVEENLIVLPNFIRSESQENVKCYYKKNVLN